MTNWIIAVLLLVGSIIMLIGSVGLVRMPDLYSRMQATTKSMTLAVVCLLLAVVIYFGEPGVTLRALLVITFYCVTSPIAAHMIGRAAYFCGVPLWEKTQLDELRGRYDHKTRTLDSGPAGAESGADAGDAPRYQSDPSPTETS